MKNLLFVFTLLLPCLSLTAYAASIQHINNGFIELTLNASDKIAREITKGKILTIIGKNFSGEINLLWNNEQFTAEIYALRSELISNGIDPQRIFLQRESGGFHINADARIVIKRLRLRRPECSGNSQNYHFNASSEPGCALTNNLYNALVTPYHF
ncbi:hypothetical protein FHW31_003689 [Enterobacter asburiae]|uniref:hypothetical protein n=1 Tax=Enterobacter asburiae TaxID=61645 RepID=UPI00141A8939|nr:hypothetical protein [Enterobacter asburiae]NIH92214.1 hypothetical protein [Enterobacter asburiae]